MWGLEILAEKNSSAAKQAAFPARCKMAGKASDSALVRGTIAFTYRTITYFIVPLREGLGASFTAGLVRLRPVKVACPLGRVFSVWFLSWGRGRMNRSTY